ncbi:MAG TPA: DinB family protein [Blastocatellia bacterium]|nr:DinB family protein [Blastocatellia bacterium]
MKDRIYALRYLMSALAISCACSVVSLANITAPVTALAAPTQSKVSEEWRAKMIADWTRAREYTKEYLDAMPEDGTNYKPNAQDKEMRTFAEQMLHLTANLFGLGSIATGGTNPYQGKNLEKMDEYKTKAALSKIVLEGYDFMIAAVKSLDLAKGGEALKLFNRFDTTRAGAIAAAFEHQTHHRGQTTIYIRMKGVKPPQEKLF